MRWSLVKFCLLLCISLRCDVTDPGDRDDLKRVANEDRVLLDLNIDHPPRKPVHAINTQISVLKDGKTTTNNKDLVSGPRTENPWLRFIRDLGDLPICAYNDPMLGDQRDDGSGVAGRNGEHPEPCYPLNFDGPGQSVSLPPHRQ